jgi:hypothetical protein
VEVAEQFADGAGRFVEWEPGQGNGQAILARNLKRRPEGDGVAEWESMLRRLDEEKRGLREEVYTFRYDNATPEDAAAWTLYLRTDLPWVVSNYTSWLRAAPYSYWKQLHELDPPSAADEEWTMRHQGERTAQAGLIHEIAGNPFRQVSINPDRLYRDDGLTTKLAQALYDDKAFDQLPVLADALEEAGCRDLAILSHLRGPGPHVRGCWVVDLILGKQ